MSVALALHEALRARGVDLGRHGKGNWRIVFRFLDGDVYDVELIDYH